MEGSKDVLKVAMSIIPLFSISQHYQSTLTEPEAESSPSSVLGLLYGMYKDEQLFVKKTEELIFTPDGAVDDAYCKAKIWHRGGISDALVLCGWYLANPAVRDLAELAPIHNYMCEIMSVPVFLHYQPDGEAEQSAASLTNSNPGALLQGKFTLYKTAVFTETETQVDCQARLAGQIDWYVDTDRLSWSCLDQIYQAQMPPTGPRYLIETLESERRRLETILEQIDAESSHNKALYTQMSKQWIEPERLAELDHADRTILFLSLLSENLLKQD